MRYEKQYKPAGGKLIQINLEIQEEKIKSIKITGDFFIHPEETLKQLEEKLSGKKIGETKKTITDYFTNTATGYGIDAKSLSHILTEIQDEYQTT